MVTKDYVEGLKSHIEYLKETKTMWRDQAYKALEEIDVLKKRIAELEGKHDAGIESKKESS